MDSPAVWNDDFDKRFYSQEEIDESDARVAKITEKIDNGHNSMLPFGRSSVDA